MWVRVNSWRMHYVYEGPHKGRRYKDECVKESERKTNEYDGSVSLEGGPRLAHRAKGTIMNIRSLKVSGICIWLFCNLPLLQKDASAPPAIYHSIKPLLYYNLIFANGPDQSYVCNFSRTILHLCPVEIVYFGVFVARNWVHTMATKLCKCFQVCIYFNKP